MTVNKGRNGRPKETLLSAISSKLTYNEGKEYGIVRPMQGSRGYRGFDIRWKRKLFIYL